MSSTIGIIGKGAFGGALAQVYQQAGHRVEHWARDYPKAPPVDLLLLAVPTASIEQVVASLCPATLQTWIFCCKGFLHDGRLPTATAPDGQPTAVLSGPGFASELLAAKPAIHTIAAKDPSQAATLAQALSTPRFRLYWSADPIGVQVCGATKNVIAIAAGILDALALGENARAALLTRGVAELRRIVQALGGSDEVLWSPAGLGDLVLTATSPQSRNFRFGQAIGRGKPPATALAHIGTVEGLHALSGVEAAMPLTTLPLCSALKGVIEGTVAADQAIAALMRRPITQG